MIVLLFTIWALAACMLMARALRVDGHAAQALMAVTTACSIIVGTLTLLGATGFLTRAWVIGLAGSAIALVALCSLVAIRRRPDREGSADAARDGLAAIGDTARALRHADIAVALLISLIAWCWVAAAIYWLPPRSVDDLVYHLPPVFEAAQRGEFVLLPVEFRYHFAFPLNAEMLFLWPIVLQKELSWVDGGQLAGALLGMLAVVAIARELGASKRSSALAAMMFVLMPLTLRQASSCYTDLTIAGFYGAALWGAIRFSRTGSPPALLQCAMGVGLLAGTKYHYLFPILMLAPLIVRGMRLGASAGGSGRLPAALLALPAPILGSWWYLRNLIALGNPFYPFGVGIGSHMLFRPSIVTDPGDPLQQTLFSAFLGKPTGWMILSLRDVGVGGIDGGLGPIFWGAVVPCGLFGIFQSALQFVRRRETLPFLISIQFAGAIIPFLVSPVAFSFVTERFLLAAAVAGFAFLAPRLDTLAGISAGIRAATVWGMIAISALSILILGSTRDLNERKQTMDFSGAVDARARAVYHSPWRFIERASHGIGRFAPAWEMIDMLSRPSGLESRRLWIYATGQYPAGFYGTHLQNRIWNFAPEAERPAEPDVLVFYLGIQRRADEITYIGPPVYRFEDVVSDTDRYELVLTTPETLVFIPRELLVRDEDMRNRLALYFERAHPDEMAIATALGSRIGEGTLIAAAGPGYGFMSLHLRDRMEARVILARPGRVEDLVERYYRKGPVWLLGLSGTAALPVHGEYRQGDTLYSLYRVPGPGSGAETSTSMQDTAEKRTGPR